MTTKTVHTFILNSCCSGILLLMAASARAELTDVTQTTPNVPGGAIEKSLEQQIGAGGVFQDSCRVF
ncbi:hypothetical protein [Methylobacter sp.]|uniref:hypothetical protein n=1 Tax=Methylobacter sp. TaxID=2051955 RepID=UPI003DA520A6